LARILPDVTINLIDPVNPPEQLFGSREASMSEPFLPADTSVEAARVQHGIYRRMAPEQRLQLVFQMTASTRAVTAAGVRSRHPDYSERQVQLAVIRLALGEELFRRVYPGENVAG
jgi:hypothetical protein